MKDRAWSRPLKNNRQEIVVRMSDSYLHMTGEPEHCAQVLAAFELAIGTKVYMLSSSPVAVIEGQTTIEEMLA